MVGEDNLLTIKSKIDLIKLPPAEESLKPHIYCVNHHVAMYKRASELIYWTPKIWDKNEGWVKNDNGVLDPVCFLWSILQSLVDILETTADNLEGRNKANETDKDEKMDFEAMFDVDLDIWFVFIPHLVLFIKYD